MDWVIVLIVVIFAVLIASRAVVGIWFPESWINAALENNGESENWGDDCGGGDGGD